MKKILVIMSVLFSAAAFAGPNYLRDNGTFQDVLTGTSSNQLLFNNAGTLGGMANTPNGVLATNGSSVPSMQPLVDAMVSGTAAINATKLLYLSSIANAVNQTIQNRLKQVVFATDFGVVADGTTDNEAAINKIIANVPSGSTIILPDGRTHVSTCTNNAVFDYSGSNGNKQHSWIGAAQWALKNGGVYTAPTGSLIEVDPAIPNTCSVFHFAGTDAVFGMVLANFAIVPTAGNSVFATIPGKCGVFFDATGSDTFYHNQDIISHVFIGHMAAGQSLCASANSTGAGVLYNTTIVDSQLMDTNLTYIADNVRMVHNTFGQNSVGTVPGVEATFVAGAAGFVYFDNVMSNIDGMLVIHNGTNVSALFNEFEQPASSTNTYGAIVDWKGDTGTIVGGTSFGNSIAQNSTIANYIPEHVQAITGLNIWGGYRSVPSSAGHITIESTAARTYVDVNTCYTGGTAGACVVPNSSATTVLAARTSGSLVSGNCVSINSAGNMADYGQPCGTASATLTFGTHLTAGGSSYNGSMGVTITPDATAANTASTMMARDGSGQVAATTFTGALTGHASLDLATSALGANVQAVLANTLGAPGTGMARSPSYFEAYLSSNQSVTDSTFTLIAPDTVLLDSNSWWNASTHLYTPQLAGNYQVTVKARCGVATTLTACVADVRKNATSAITGYWARAGNPGFGATGDAQTTAIVTMNGSTDTIEGYAFAQGTGGSDVLQGQAISSGGMLTYMTITYIGP